MFLVSALAGIVCMTPAVSFGDSGELIASAATLSIAHAPGYPLMSLIGHATGTLLPLGTWAYRVNLVSVLCSAGALSLFWDAMRRTGQGRTEAALGTIFLGLSGLWLHTSLQTEVFALNGLCAAAALWVYCRYSLNLFDSRPMALLGLALGLGGANHHTLILIVPALLAAGWVSSRPKGERLVGGLAILLTFGLLGLAVYCYLPIRARVFPPLDWGHPVDPGSFLHVLLRRDYGSFSLTVEGADEGRWVGVYRQTVRYVRALYSGFGPAGCLLAVAGVFASRADGRKIPAWAPLAWLVLAGPFFLWLGNPPFDALTSGALGRFHLLSWFGVAWLIVWGAGGLCRYGPRARVVALAFFLFPIGAAAAKSSDWNQRWDLAAHDYGRNLLRSLPPDSAFFIDGGDDSFYTTAYNLFAESRRTDIEPHDRGGLVFPNAYGPDFRKLSRAKKEVRRKEVESAYADRGPTFYQTLQDSLLPGHPLGYWGILRRADSPVSRMDMWFFYVARHSVDLAKAHYRYRALIPVYDVMRGAEDLSVGKLATALKRFHLAAELGSDSAWVQDNVSKHAQWVGYRSAEMKDYDLAQEAYQLALRMKPMQLDIWLNLGVTFEKNERLDEAESAYRGAVAIAPEDHRSYYYLGALFWKKKDWGKAAAQFEKAARLKDGDAAIETFALRARRRAQEE